MLGQKDYSTTKNYTDMSKPKPVQVKCLFAYVLEKVQDVSVSTRKSHLKKLQSLSNEIIYVKTLFKVNTIKVLPDTKPYSISFT